MFNGKQVGFEEGWLGLDDGWQVGCVDGMNIGTIVGKEVGLPCG